MEHIRKTNKKLGVGARGVVYEGYDEERGRFVAVKEIPFFDGGGGGGGAGTGNSPAEGGEEEEDPAFVEERRAIVREISLMERFEHPNLVAYYGARRSAVGVQIIMELVNGGSLDALIRRHGCLRESVVRSYTHDVLEGLAYLHETARVCHRDVKPANVLITADGRCKLTDFGVSKLLDDNGTMRTTVGTPWYMAPEVVNGSIDDDVEDNEEVGCSGGGGGSGGVSSNGDGRLSRGGGGGGGSSNRGSYTTAADIWSLGVTVFEMISGKKPFGGEMKNPTAVLFAIASANATPPRLPDSCEATPSLRAFLDLCFVRDARLRPRARELLSHQWFFDVPTPTSRAASKAAPRRSGGTNGVCDGLPLGPMQRLLRPSLSMLDTADLISNDVHSPMKELTPMSQERLSLRRLSSESGGASLPREAGGGREMQGGFWSSDGHYVDLVVAPPLASPTAKRRAR
ncbi:putative protein kinase [Trypanosoma grayi]|uniref:putative protein kinase n=1 Tax=Trypanosoma grayi TaxID=71804 RepID=UPI0004F4B250|nr:putative protein kinase [Trypanosoma grayi]KEG11297.1 putative protein kinase [Trypanosoma grayi]